MNKNILLLAAAGIGLLFLFNNSHADTAGYDTNLINAWIERIKSDSVWYSAEVEKANNNGITIDAQLLIDAKYCIDQGWTL